MFTLFLQLMLSPIRGWLLLARHRTKRPGVRGSLSLEVPDAQPIRWLTSLLPAVPPLKPRNMAVARLPSMGMWTYREATPRLLLNGMTLFPVVLIRLNIPSGLPLDPVLLLETNGTTPFITLG